MLRLDHRKPRRKYRCPSCGRAKCFTRFYDPEGVIDVPDEIGFCDHAVSCGYSLTPGQYLAAHPEMANRFSRPPQTLADIIAGSPAVSRTPPPPPRASLIESHIVDASLTAYHINPLHRYLCTLFPRQAVNGAFERYRVGTSRLWGGSTVFWQTDSLGNTRGGKVMAYNPADGHRLKNDGMPSVTWVHSLLRLRGFNLSQCYFGEHLLPRLPSARVIIVESEKTALICSIVYPQHVWLATGGLTQLKARACLSGRDVTLLPDLGCAQAWGDRIHLFTPVCRHITVSHYLERIADPAQRAASLDIADFIIAAQVGKNGCV